MIEEGVNKGTYERTDDIILQDYMELLRLTSLKMLKT